MEIRKVIAIVRCERLETVEEQLQENRVRGLTVTQVKGYGEHSNIFRHDWLEGHARIEIFAERVEAERIARIIIEAAHGGGEGDGLVAIQPVENIYRIRTKAEVQPGDI